jgi:DNA-binding transcriptional LysR family regulator
MVEIQRLRYFLAVARSLHFRKAAEKTGTTQPNLTRQLRILEDSLGTTLLDRDRRNVQLTVSGARLLPLAEQIVNLVEALGDKVRAPNRPKVIRIGHIPAALFSIIPKEIRAFQKLLPGVDFSLSEGFPPQLLRALSASTIDLAFSLGAATGGELSSRMISSERNLIALPSDNVAAKRKGPLALQELLNLDWITIPDSHRPAPTDPLLSYMDYLGFAPSRRKLVETQQAILGYVAAGQGFALLPACLAKMAPRTVTFKHAADPLPKFNVFVIWRRTELDSDVIRIIKQRYEHR